VVFLLDRAIDDLLKLTKLELANCARIIIIRVQKNNAAACAVVINISTQSRIFHIIVAETIFAIISLLRNKNGRDFFSVELLLRSLPNFFVTETKECGYSYF
jgi:hypothetical protein